MQFILVFFVISYSEASVHNDASLFKLELHLHSLIVIGPLANNRISLNKKVKYFGFKCKSLYHEKKS